jgi:hypothetical protein
MAEVKRRSQIRILVNVADVNEPFTEEEKETA